MKPLVLFLLLCFDLSFQADSDAPPKVDIFSLHDCSDEKVPPPAGFACETAIAGEGQSKSFNAKLTIPFDLDDSIKYRVALKEWVDGNWKEISFKLSGIVCEHGPKYLPGVWEKLSKAVGVSPNCPIKAGTYSVNGFTAESRDVRFPFAVPGKFLVSVLVSRDETPIVCKQAELTITE